MEEEVASELARPRQHVRVLETIDEIAIEGATFPLLDDRGSYVWVLLPDGGIKMLEKGEYETFSEQATSAPELTPPIESFSCAVKVSDELAASRVVRLIQRFIPSSLKTLTLATPWLNDVHLKELLTSFPLLDTLRLKSHQLSAKGASTSAFDRPDCVIQALELRGSEVAVLGLLALLKDPTTRTNKQLKQLQLSFSWTLEARDVFIEAVVEMLSTNHRLEFLKISGARECVSEVNERLRGLCLQAAPTQRKLALVSAIHEASSTSSALGSLDCTIVSMVMELAEMPRFCRFCVES